MKTIECISDGKCYYLSKEYFIHCVNLFKFSQNVIEEQIFKHHLYCNRMMQTHEFQRKFIKAQQDMLQLLIARDKVREDEEERKREIEEKRK